MRGVLIDVPASLIAERQRLGLDRYDEMWEGVYHMPPDPTVGHQDAVSTLIRALFDPVHAAGLKVMNGLNVCHPDQTDRDYRIPDVIVIDRDLRFDVKDGFGVSGGISLAFEIRSPGDEAYLKVPFYAARGVQTLVIIDQLARLIVVDRLVDGAYVETRGRGPFDVGFGVSVEVDDAGGLTISGAAGTWRV